MKTLNVTALDKQREALDNYATLDEIVDLFCRAVDRMSQKERAAYRRKAMAHLSFAFLKLYGRAN